MSLLLLLLHAAHMLCTYGQACPLPPQLPQTWRLLPSSRPLGRARRLVLAAATPWSAPLVPAPSLLDEVMMDPFASSGAGLRALDELDARLDASLGRAFGDFDRLQRSLDEDMSRSLSELRRTEPGGVRIERREERGAGSYRYYESITIRGGGAQMVQLAPTHSLPSPLLAAALAVVAVYTALTALFARNFELTAYKRDLRSRVSLVLLWPALAALSSRFREQWWCALRGRTAPALHPIDAGITSEKGGGAISDDGSSAGGDPDGTGGGPGVPPAAR